MWESTAQLSLLFDILSIFIFQLDTKQTLMPYSHGEIS